MAPTCIPRKANNIEMSKSETKEASKENSKANGIVKQLLNVQSSKFQNARLLQLFQTSTAIELEAI